MNLNLRKSLRKSSRSSTFYLDSFEMLERKFLKQSDGKQSGASIPLVGFRAQESILPIKPIDGVIYYSLNSRRTKGTIGQLILTTQRIVFAPYRTEQTTSETSADLVEEPVRACPPFEAHSAALHDGLEGTLHSQHSELDYANLLDILQDGSVLQLYCADFRCLEFQLKSVSLVKQLSAQLEKHLLLKPFLRNSITATGSSIIVTSMITSPTHSPLSINQKHTLSLFWRLVARQYPFNLPQHWEINEGHWYSLNRLLRISQANEHGQLCKSLPFSFITLKYYLTDVNLLQTISPQMKAQRVPFITYSYKVRDLSGASGTRSRFFRTEAPEHTRDHMLLRSGSLSKEVHHALTQAISPLRIVDVGNLLPELTTLLNVYGKLRHACFPYASTGRFLFHVGKWLKLVSKLLIIAQELANVLRCESSLLLVEEDDDLWNMLLATLIQLILDPTRRTIGGFCALLSKEWIYMQGLIHEQPFSRTANASNILLTLFLDCVQQLQRQEPHAFEFNSLFLIRCFDLACEFNIQHSLFTEHPLSSHQADCLLFTDLTPHQVMFFYNPFYKQADPATENFLRFSTSVLCMHLWRSFYLRWLSVHSQASYYSQFDEREQLYFSKLLLSENRLPRIELLFEQLHLQNDVEEGVESDSQCSF